MTIVTLKNIKDSTRIHNRNLQKHAHKCKPPSIFALQSRCAPAKSSITNVTVKFLTGNKKFVTDPSHCFNLFLARDGLKHKTLKIRPPLQKFHRGIYRRQRKDPQTFSHGVVVLEYLPEVHRQKMPIKGG